MLGYADPFQLLVAVILSAQTTDVGVNKVTPILFAKYPDAESLAAADPAEVEEIVHPTGFFRNKTRNIMGAAQRIANIVLANSFGVVVGIPVDTHVFRLSHRLGFTTKEDPVKVERDLMALFPHETWYDLTYRLIEHGRATCIAQRPVCGECSLSELCPSAFEVKGWRERR